MHIFTRLLIFKGLTAQHLYKSFSIKGLISEMDSRETESRGGRWKEMALYHT
jgi:hypothetical protein